MWGPGVMATGLCSRNRAGLIAEILWRWQRHPGDLLSATDIASSLGSEMHIINTIIKDMTRKGLLIANGEKLALTPKGSTIEVKRPEGWRYRTQADKEEPPVRFSKEVLPVVQQLLDVGTLIISKENLAPLRRLANRTQRRPAYVEIEGVVARVGARAVMPPRVRSLLKRRGILLGKDL